MAEGLARAVSFDFGQTLAELDTEMLCRRLQERQLQVSADKLEEELPHAWAAYDGAVREGVSGHPWKLLMRTLLDRSGIPGPDVAATVDWLWTEQPKQNLWRRPIGPMIALVRELVGDGVPVAILSNSEGRLQELVDEMGLTNLFVGVADSGRLGIEKPDRAIFEWTASCLGTPLAEIVHVGDSRAADVDGALRAGMRAIWYSPAQPAADASPRMATCRDAAEVRRALSRWGALP